MVRIFGKLTTPAGGVVKVATIILRSKTTTIEVLKGIETVIDVTDGTYDFSVHPGEYNVLISESGRDQYQTLKVRHNSPAGSLNTFMISNSVEQLTPEETQIFEGLLASTDAAKNAAKDFSDKAKQSADDAARVVTFDYIAGIMDKYARRNIYINNASGDDLNDGSTIAKAVKTFGRAFALMPSAGGTATMLLVGDYGFKPEERSQQFVNACVTIKSASTRAVIKFNYYTSSPDEYSMTSFDVRHGGTIEFRDVTLELPGLPADHGVGKKYFHTASVVKTSASDLVSALLNVRLTKVDIVVPSPEKSEWNLVGNPGGLTNLSMHSVTYPEQWKARNKLSFGIKRSAAAVHTLITNVSNAFSTDENLTNDGVVK